MKNELKLLATLALLTNGALANGQSAFGTVVVIGKSQTKIVVAADSRATILENRQHSDHFCKIRALDNRSVFTAAGYILHGKLWDGFSEANISFDEAKSSGGPHVLKTAAITWGNRMVTRINKALAVDFAGSTADVEENLFFSGVFLGYEQGSPAFDQVIVRFDPSTKKANRSFDFETVHPEMHWGAFGRNETVYEVLADKTDFGKREWAKWSIAQQQIPVENEDVQLAIHLVELTAVYNPRRTEIGGPIDALEITPNGVKWIQRKPECRSEISH